MSPDLSTVLAATAVIISVLSALFTRQQVVEAKRVRMISEDERHDQLTPEFSRKLEPFNSGPEEERVMLLQVQLLGPVGLYRLDDLVIEVQNHRHRPTLGAGSTEAEVETQVWGPYRFVPGADGATPDGRRATPLAYQRPDGTLPKGESIRVQMERTRAPHWYATGQNGWEKDFPAEGPVKLRLMCRMETHRWEVPVEITGSGWSPGVMVL